MENINNVRKLTRASMLLVFALVIIFTGARLGGAVFNQIVVGPLVNAVLFTTILIVDLKFGVLVAISTPILAAVTGQFTILPFLPFIMVGNIILVLTFGIFIKLIKKYGSYIGVAAGAVLKFLFLSVSASYMVSLFNLPIPQAAVKKLGEAMSYPQLYTALAGGVVAIIFNFFFKRNYRNA